MATPFEHRLPADHSAEEVWQAINIPLCGRVAVAVHPWFEIGYAFLDDELRIGAGTVISYRPSMALVDRVPEPFRDTLPADITFRVEERDPDSRTRLDVLQSGKAEGTVWH